MKDTTEIAGILIKHVYSTTNFIKIRLASPQIKTDYADFGLLEEYVASYCINRFKRFYNPYFDSKVFNGGKKSNRGGHRYTTERDSAISSLWVA
jgi:hypothetical protein